MQNNIKNIVFILKFSLLLFANTVFCQPFWASEGTKASTTIPEIIRINVAGIAELAEMSAQLCKQYPPERTLFISDLHGVQSRNSLPVNHPTHRGSMPDYTKCLISRGYPFIVASAWHDEEKVFSDINSLGLRSNLNLHGEPMFGSITLGETKYQYYKLGSVSALREVSGFKETSHYFRKALTPVAIYGPERVFDLMIFIDDSTQNIDAFIKDAPKAPYYTSLKKLVLFCIPPIDGKDLEIDYISPEFLPQEFRTREYYPEGYMNPLAQSGYYSIDAFNSDEPVAPLSKPPAQVFVPKPKISARDPQNVITSPITISLPGLISSSVVPASTTQPLTVQNPFNTISTPVITRLPQFDFTPVDPLRHTGIFTAADFEDDDDDAFPEGGSPSEFDLNAMDPLRQSGVFPTTAFEDEYTPQPGFSLSQSGVFSMHDTVNRQPTPELKRSVDQLYLPSPVLHLGRSTGSLGNSVGSPQTKNQMKDRLISSQ